jgi:four helix bundle protein
MPVWQQAIEIAVEVFHLTERLPRKEDFSLTSQLRRSALSISANIAEAFGRQHQRDKVNFYYFSRGSITETMSHLEYASRVNYFSRDGITTLNASLEQLMLNVNRIIKSFTHKRTDIRG